MAVVDTAVEVAVEMLTANDSARLDLFRCSLGDTGGATQLADALRGNTSVTAVRLEAAMLTHTGVATILDAVSQQGRVAELSLAHNHLGPHGASHVATLLQASSALHTLSLRCTLLGDSGVDQLSMALADNTTLTTLDLRSELTVHPPAGSGGSLLSAMEEAPDAHHGYGFGAGAGRGGGDGDDVSEYAASDATTIMSDSQLGGPAGAFMPPLRAQRRQEWGGFDDGGLDGEGERKGGRSPGQSLSGSLSPAAGAGVGAAEPDAGSSGSGHRDDEAKAGAEAEAKAGAVPEAGGSGAASEGGPTPTAAAPLPSGADADVLATVDTAVSRPDAGAGAVGSTADTATPAAGALPTAPSAGGAVHVAAVAPLGDSLTSSRIQLPQLDVSGKPRHAPGVVPSPLRITPVGAPAPLDSPGAAAHTPSGFRSVGGGSGIGSASMAGGVSASDLPTRVSLGGGGGGRGGMVALVTDPRARGRGRPNGRAAREALAFTRPSYKSLGAPAAARPISAMGAAALARCLKVNSTLLMLRIDRNHIGDKGIRTLCSALGSNYTTCGLKKLTIGYNGITAAGAKELGLALTANTRLTELSMAGNNIRCDGAAAIIQGSAKAAALKKVDFTACGLIEEDTEPMFDAVTEHPSLQELVLDHNNVGDIGALALSGTFRRNTTLSAVSMVHCHLGEGGARRALYELQRCSRRTVKSLDLSENQLSRALMDEMDVLLRRNNRGSKSCAIM